MVSTDRIKISNDRKTVEIRQLEESDTALYSSMVESGGGNFGNYTEITRYWLMVRGNETFLSLHSCQQGGKTRKYLISYIFHAELSTFHQN